MIKNYINIDDLLVKEPRLFPEYNSSDIVIKNHVHDAFNRVCTELSKKNIDTRLVMLPVQLHNTDVFNNQIGGWVKVHNKNRVKRIVVKTNIPLPPSTTFRLTLEGTNDMVTSAQPLVTIALVDTDFVTTTFSTEYNFYRFKIEAEEINNIQANIFLVEISFDDLIIYKALENCFAGLYRVETDGFMSKMQMYKLKFETELETLVFAYDLNNEIDKNKKSTIIRVGL